MENESVFKQLRSLARRLEQESVILQEKVNNPGKNSDDIGSAHAYKHLQDMKKNVHALKDEAREKLATLQIGNNRFQQLLELLPQVIEFQQQSLAATEEYLMQYGYTQREKKPVPTVKEAATNNDKNPDEEDGDGTFTISAEAVSQANNTTPPVKPKPSQCKTPSLEDYGLSSFTLNMMQRGGAFINQSTLHNSQQQTAPSYEPGLSEDSPTPLSFKHNGLLVTPSLLGGRSVLEQTPDCTSRGFGITPINFMESPAQFTNTNTTLFNGQDRFSHAACISGSPLPPVLHTPGAKQINKQLYQEIKKEDKKVDMDSPIPPLLMTPGVKQISKSVSIPNPVTSKSIIDNDSPAVPVLMTPGSKQIKKNNSVKPPSPPPMSASVWDKEPEMPELTMSLQDITQLTQSFRLNQSNVHHQVEPPVKMSGRVKDRATPPLPELLSTKLAQLGTQSGSHGSTNLPVGGDSSLSASILSVTKDCTPPPPTLLGKYNFMSKYTQENIPPYGQ